MGTVGAFASTRERSRYPGGRASNLLAISLCITRSAIRPPGYAGPFRVSGKCDGGFACTSCDRLVLVEWLLS
jgi:hypothetical protein